AAGPGDGGEPRVGTRPTPGLGGQRVPPARPALPWVVERHARVDHDPTLWQEDVVDRPVEAARGAESRHVPGSLDDLCLRALEDAPPMDRGAVRASAQLVAVENLEAAQHPGALLTAGAEGPPPADPVA